jgi:hypothetical protein
VGQNQAVGQLLQHGYPTQCTLEDNQYHPQQAERQEPPAVAVPTPDYESLRGHHHAYKGCQHAMGVFYKGVIFERRHKLTVT